MTWYRPSEARCERSLLLNLFLPLLNGHGVPAFASGSSPQEQTEGLGDPVLAVGSGYVEQVDGQ